MPCYNPAQGWRARRPNPSGKRNIVFNKNEGYADQEVTVPCNRCIGCRLDFAQMWAIRCMHEAEMHEDNCFITLTYTDENIPKIGDWETLDKEDLQKFMKRLRWHYKDKDIRFYAAGEYGDNTQRPHYHICIFGMDFEDKQLFQEKNGTKLYTSQILQKLWPKGFSTIGEMNFKTASYTARYVMKKIKGKKDQYLYDRQNMDGSIVRIQPEFAQMSRRPALGLRYMEKWSENLLRLDFIVYEGKQIPIPKYYRQKLEQINDIKSARNKYKRREATKKALINNSLARLYIRGKCKEAQIKNLKKEL